MEAFAEIAMTRPATALEPDPAFDAMMSSQRGRLYGIAYSILHDAGLAEDALQDSMVKAWRSWDQLRDENARNAWLTQITVRQCINRRKFWKLRAAVPLSENRDHAALDPRLSGRLVDLDKCYARLSTKQRAAIFLHYHFGYSIEECAPLMGCSPGSVRTHLHRAIQSLRKGMSHV